MIAESLAILPHRPKVSEKLFFFLSGILISAPFPFLVDSLIAYALYLSLPAFSAAIISIALISPILEEFAKAFPLFFRHGETEKSLFNLGFLTGLGFGVAEFLFYVLALGVPPLLRLPAILFHATNTSIVAYGIGRGKSFQFYALAVLLHFVNNFALMAFSWGTIVYYVVTLTSLVTAFILYTRTSERQLAY